MPLRLSCCARRVASDHCSFLSDDCVTSRDVHLCTMTLCSMPSREARGSEARGRSQGPFLAEVAVRVPPLEVGHLSKPLLVWILLRSFPEPTVRCAGTLVPVERLLVQDTPISLAQQILPTPASMRWTRAGAAASGGAQVAGGCGEPEGLRAEVSIGAPGRLLPGEDPKCSLPAAAPGPHRCPARP